jgi:hypothetical protein
VDSALLAAADPTVDPVGDLVIEVLAPYALDKCTLLAGVANALRCQGVRRQGWADRGGADRGWYERRKTFSMHLFGHDSDLRRTEVLFTSLLVQAGYALVAQDVPEWENVAAYRRSWFAGYTFAIVARLREAEERAAASAADDQTGGRSMALVLADRSAEVAQRVAEAYPRIRFAEPRRLAGGGMEHGYEAGRRADLGAPRVRPRGGSAAIRAR